MYFTPDFLENWKWRKYPTEEDYDWFDKQVAQYERQLERVNARLTEQEAWIKESSQRSQELMRQAYAQIVI